VNPRLVVGISIGVAVAVAITALIAGDGEQPPPRGPADTTVTADPRLPLRDGFIVGYVRDVNGRPVARARVRLADGSSSTRASRSGRFELRAEPGPHTVLAARPAYTRQSVDTTLPRGRGARVDFALAVSAPDQIAMPNSADRLIVWTACDQVVRLSERALRRWVARGADGFVCQTGRLRGLGGNQRFSDDRRGLARTAETSLQRRLEASPAVRWARRGKLRLYLGFYASNYFNRSTPFHDWFDARGWSRDVLPQVEHLAAAAESMGFAGLAIDQELYPQDNGEQTASWEVDYPGNRRSEAEVRAKVTDRGRQLMKRMVGAFPGLELVTYNTQVPENWQEKVQADANDFPDVFAGDVRVDLLDGMLSVPGYSAIRWMDSIFYKTFQLPDASWDTALEYNANRIYSYLSRRVSNWRYASSRLHVSPFSWVDEGPGSFDRARGPEHVAEQLAAFHRWGAGGSFANYAYAPLDAFDYAPYEDALRRASSPARVDRKPPDLQLTSPPGVRGVSAGQTIDLSGVADDDFAIRAVRWYDDRGREGTAKLTWEFTGDQRSAWNGEMRWSIENLDAAPDSGHITISAEDIHGLARQLRLTVAR
jgi:hypothetical protein